MMLIVSAGAFMANLDASIVNVSLPTMGNDFHTTPGRVSLVVLSYPPNGAPAPASWTPEATRGKAGRQLAEFKARRP